MTTQPVQPSFAVSGPCLSCPHSRWPARFLGKIAASHPCFNINLSIVRVPTLIQQLTTCVKLRSDGLNFKKVSSWRRLHSTRLRSSRSSPRGDGDLLIQDAEILNRKNPDSSIVIRFQMKASGGSSRSTASSWCKVQDPCCRAAYKRGSDMEPPMTQT